MEVEPRLKPDPELCPCGCGLFGPLAKGTGHVKACPSTCPKCRGKRNRTKGRDKQKVARRALGVPDAKQASSLGHEEAWRWVFAVEVKAGAQVGPLATRFLACEKQSSAPQNQVIGNMRPFLMVAMPDGWGSDGVVAMRLSTWRDHIAPLIDEYGGTAA